MKCAVCNMEPAVGVANCGLGLPLSVAYGKNCLLQGAERPEDIQVAIELSGKLSEAELEFVDSFMTFHDGKYMTFGEYKKETK